MINGYFETIIVLILINSIFALSLNLILGFNGQFSLGHAAFLAIGAYTSAILVGAFGFPLIIGLVLAGVLASLLGLITGVPTLRLRGDYLAIATLGFAEITKMVLLILPDRLFGGATGIPGGASAINRVPQFADVLRIPGAVSQDFAGKMLSELPGSPPSNINQALNIVFTYFFAFAAIAVSIYGIYAFYRFFKSILLRKFPGGPGLWIFRAVYWVGIAVFAAANSSKLNNLFYKIFEVHHSRTWASYFSTQWSVFLFLLIVVALVTWLCVNYIKSSYGRAVLAIREDEIASTMLGIGEFRYKLINFLIGTFFAGVAGGLLAHSIPAFNPFEFDLFKSVDVLLMVVLGGMGSITGTFFGATAITILPEALRQWGQWRMVIYSLTLVLLMIFKPSGFFGSAEFKFEPPDFLKRFLDKRRGKEARENA